MSRRPMAPKPPTRAESAGTALITPSWSGPNAASPGSVPRRLGGLETWVARRPGDVYSSLTTVSYYCSFPMTRLYRRGRKLRANKAVFMCLWVGCSGSSGRCCQGQRRP